MIVFGVAYQRMRLLLICFVPWKKWSQSCKFVRFAFQQRLLSCIDTNRKMIVFKMLKLNLSQTIQHKRFRIVMWQFMKRICWKRWISAVVSQKQEIVHRSYIVRQCEKWIARTAFSRIRMAWNVWKVRTSMVGRGSRQRRNEIMRCSFVNWIKLRDIMQWNRYRRLRAAFQGWQNRVLKIRGTQSAVLKIRYAAMVVETR